jgi:beta-phosphoglucomutase-like phosphatase (HAD superfamily)
MSEQNIRLVFFDFDGVVLDSARIKTEAFPLVFSDYPEHIEAITKYHLANQGISRYEKFEWIYNALLQKPLSEEKSKVLGDKFSAVVLEKVLKCPAMPGAIEFLTFLKNISVPAVVASGTPYRELLTIIHEREIDYFFADVWGSPMKKAEIIKILTGIHGIAAEDCLFIGDASTDYEAAKAMNVPFQAIYSKEMMDFWKEVGETTIADLMELKKLFS